MRHALIPARYDLSLTPADHAPPATVDPRPSTFDQRAAQGALREARRARRDPTILPDQALSRSLRCARRVARCAPNRLSMVVCRRSSTSRSRTPRPPGGSHLPLRAAACTRLDFCRQPRVGDPTPPRSSLCRTSLRHRFPRSCRRLPPSGWILAHRKINGTPHPVALFWTRLDLCSHPNHLRVAARRSDPGGCRPATFDPRRTTLDRRAARSAPRATSPDDTPDRALSRSLRCARRVARQSSVDSRLSSGGP